MFKVNLKDPAERAFVVTEKLHLLHQELEAAHLAMLATGVNPEHYKNAFQGARRVIVPQDLTLSWIVLKSVLKPEIFSTLALCVEVLPNEERLLEDEEMERIWSMLEELKQEVDSSELPEDVRKFILEQIAIIEKTLDEYEITGARAFRRALVAASLSYSEHEAAVDEHRDAPEVKKVVGLWGMLTRMNERSETVQKLLSSGVKIVKLVGDAADHVNKVI